MWLVATNWTGKPDRLPCRRFSRTAAPGIKGCEQASGLGEMQGSPVPLSGIITKTQRLPRSNESAVFLLLKNKLDGSLSHNVGSGIFILKNVYLTTSYFLFYLFPLFTLQVLCGFQFSILHGIPGEAADEWTRYSAFSWALCLRLVCFVPI